MVIMARRQTTAHSRSIQRISLYVAPYYNNDFVGMARWSDLL
jgi:hypothetical protein